MSTGKNTVKEVIRMEKIIYLSEAEVRIFLEEGEVKHSIRSVDLIIRRLPVMEDDTVM